MYICVVASFDIIVVVSVCIQWLVHILILDNLICGCFEQRTKWTSHHEKLPPKSSHRK